MKVRKSKSLFYCLYSIPYTFYIFRVVMSIGWKYIRLYDGHTPEVTLRFAERFLEDSEKMNDRYLKYVGIYFKRLYLKEIRDSKAFFEFDRKRLFKNQKSS